MRNESELDAIARQIVGTSVAVHRAFGPGCFETAYTPCLAYELARCGLFFETGVFMDVVYGELVVPRAYQADFIVEESIVIVVAELRRPHHARGHQARREQLPSRDHSRWSSQSSGLVRRHQEQHARTPKRHLNVADLSTTNLPVGWGLPSAPEDSNWRFGVPA